MGSYSPPMIGSAGLSIPTYAQILNYLIQNYQSIYGVAAQLDPSQADYQDISIRALQASDCDSALQAIYFSFNILTATGVSLDYLGQLIGTTRNSASYSTALVTLTGTNGVVVSNGVIQDLNGNYWNLPLTVTIGSGGTASVTATAQVLGDITANANTITVISTPTAGWTAVTNPDAAVPGDAQEPDSAYRARLMISQAKPSLSLRAGTAAAVAAVPGVTRSVVYENYFGYTASYGFVSTSGTTVTLVQGYPFDSTMDTNAIDVNGSNYTISSVGSTTSLTTSTSVGTHTNVPFYIGDGIALGPGHSITAVVENGSPTAIANAIYANKNPGVLTNGSTTEVVTDPNNGNISINISFDILAYVQIYVVMTVQPLANYTSATTASIIAAEVAYLVGLGIGESVIYSSLYGPALSVQANPEQPQFSIKSLSSGYATASTSATLTISSANITVASTVGISTSETIVGVGIPNGTTVSSITSGQVATLTVDTAGTGYTTATGLLTTGGTGTGLTVNITASGAISAATPDAVGSGYVVGDVVTVVQSSGGTGGTLLVASTNGTLGLSATPTQAGTGVAVTVFSVSTSDITVAYNQAPAGSSNFVVVTVL